MTIPTFSIKACSSFSVYPGNRAALMHKITYMEGEFERHITIVEQYLKIPTSVNVEKTSTVVEECMDVDYGSKAKSCIVEDISSVIDLKMSSVVLEKPFVELSNMTYDLSLGVVKFTKGVQEIAYKMPHKIKQYDSLSDREKENIKSVYFRNEEDKRKGVKYVMCKILGFYKEYLELGPEYRTGHEESGSNGNQGGVTTWKIFRGNICDLGSILEGTGQDDNLARRRIEESRSECGDGVWKACDAV
ncbi:hypothetical protein Tco_0153670 [Tanacetum coccineum]